MKLKTYIQLGLYSLIVAITVALCHFFPNAATNPESGLVMYLPKDIPGHTSEIRELSLEEKKILPPDTTKLSREYLEIGLDENIARYRALSATLILAGADKRSLHKPEICLTAQGWTIDKSEPVVLDTKGGELEVMHLYLSRKISIENDESRIQRSHYVYWWVARDMSTAFANERLLISAKNNIFKNINDRWGYPSISVNTDERYGDKGNEEAIKRAYDYIINYAPLFQKSLGAKDRDDAAKLKELGDKDQWKKKGDFFEYGTEN